MQVAVRVAYKGVAVEEGPAPGCRRVVLTR
jgi:hypothetical protein